MEGQQKQQRKRRWGLLVNMFVPVGCEIYTVYIEESMKWLGIGLEVKKYDGLLNLVSKGFKPTTRRLPKH